MCKLDIYVITNILYFKLYTYFSSFLYMETWQAKKGIVLYSSYTSYIGLLFNIEIKIFFCYAFVIFINKFYILPYIHCSTDR